MRGAQVADLARVPIGKFPQGARHAALVAAVQLAQSLTRQKLGDDLGDRMRRAMQRGQPGGDHFRKSVTAPAHRLFRLAPFARRYMDRETPLGHILPRLAKVRAIRARKDRGLGPAIVQLARQALGLAAGLGSIGKSAELALLRGRRKRDHRPPVGEPIPADDDGAAFNRRQRFLADLRGHR